MSEPNDRDEEVARNVINAFDSVGIREASRDIASYREELQAAHAREVEGLNKHVSELEAELAHTILDATNRLVDARSDLMREVEGLRAALEQMVEAIEIMTTTTREDRDYDIQWDSVIVPAVEDARQALAQRKEEE